jgi:hypothetical protein
MEFEQLAMMSFVMANGVAFQKVVEPDAVDEDFFQRG